MGCRSTEQLLRLEKRRRDVGGRIRSPRNKTFYQRQDLVTAHVFDVELDHDQQQELYLRQHSRARGVSTRSLWDYTIINDNDFIIVDGLSSAGRNNRLASSSSPTAPEVDNTAATSIANLDPMTFFELAYDETFQLWPSSTTRMWAFRRYEMASMGSPTMRIDGEYYRPNPQIRQRLTNIGARGTYIDTDNDTGSESFGTLPRVLAELAQTEPTLPRVW